MEPRKYCRITDWIIIFMSLKNIFSRWTFLSIFLQILFALVGYSRSMSELFLVFIEFNIKTSKIYSRCYINWKSIFPVQPCSYLTINTVLQYWKFFKFSDNFMNNCIICFDRNVNLLLLISAHNWYWVHIENNQILTNN